MQMLNDVLLTILIEIQLFNFLLIYVLLLQLEMILIKIFLLQLMAAQSDELIFFKIEEKDTLTWTY
jgi:hypothetical protein